MTTGFRGRLSWIAKEFLERPSPIDANILQESCCFANRHPSGLNNVSRPRPTLVLTAKSITARRYAAPSRTTGSSLNGSESVAPSQLNDAADHRRVGMLAARPGGAGRSRGAGLTAAGLGSVPSESPSDLFPVLSRETRVLRFGIRIDGARHPRPHRSQASRCSATKESSPRCG